MFLPSCGGFSPWLTDCFWACDKALYGGEYTVKQNVFLLESRKQKLEELSQNYLQELPPVTQLYFVSPNLLKDPPFPSNPKDWQPNL